MAQKKSGGKAVSVIAGLAGLTAAAVGAYYLYGSKDAAKNRTKVKSWMLKAKGEVLEQLEGAEGVTESAYISAVDTVAKKYNELKTIDQAELASFVGDMKKHWVGIKKTVKTATNGKTKKAKK